ncbi:hypothetical protein [Aerosakkonema funiforme]|uniref:hypothetical protein n=1 Tax=Aerosakkonema funiforme TaxID=1246630 RepID=UPI0035BA5E14
MSAEGSRYNRGGFIEHLCEYRRWFSGETVGLNAGSGSGIAYLMNADQLITER